MSIDMQGDLQGGESMKVRGGLRMGAGIVELRKAFEDFFVGMEIKPQISADKYPAYLQAIPCDGKDAFHFELIQRGEEDDVFLEFHVERGHYWEYNEEIERLTRAFAQHRRDISHTSYYSSRIWRCRRPIVAPGDLSSSAKDVQLLKAEAVKCLMAGTGNSDGGGVEDGVSDVWIGQERVSAVLTWGLEMPQVQREYCWDVQNINELVSDLKAWKMHHEDMKYHMGSVILKEIGNDTYEIFDGQQRLTTFALWLHAAEKMDIPLLKSKKVPYSTNSRKRVVDAFNVFNSKTEFRDGDFLKWAKEMVVVSIVKIAQGASNDLPFRFFNHVNSSGVRLTDYDLLKSHHLRFVNSGIAQESAKRWHDLEMTSDGNLPLTERLLHQTLFRLRMWSFGREAYFPFDAAGTGERLLFKHFRATAETPSGMLSFPRPMHFDSLVSGGAAFFDFVSRQRTAFTAFSEEPPVKLLDKHLSWHSGGVLWSGIRALCFLYYLRFGASYLDKAVLCMAEYISQIRNETRVSGAYLSRRPHFRDVCDLLRRATDEGQFFAAMSAIAVRYEKDHNGATKENYWDALSRLQKELKNV